MIFILDISFKIMVVILITLLLIYMFLKALER